MFNNLLNIFVNTGARPKDSFISPPDMLKGRVWFPLIAPYYMVKVTSEFRICTLFKSDPEASYTCE